MEPHAGAHQVLPQITAATGIDLGAGVIEVAILDEGAPFWRPVVVSSSYYCHIRMTLPSAGVECSMRRVNVECELSRLSSSNGW